MAALVLVGCRTPAAPVDEPTPPPLSPSAKRPELAGLGPLGEVPPDPSNAYADDPRAARLGQMLFFDEDLSGPLLADNALGKAGQRGKVSCHTCHGGPALDDQHSRPNHVSIGSGIGHRNAPPILNAAFYRWGNWGGRFDSQWSLVLGAAENPAVMNANRLAIAHVVYRKYRAEYDAIFPTKLDPALDPAARDAARFPANGRPKGAGGVDGPWEAMTESDREIANRIFANVGKSVAAYMRKLVARDAPLDRYLAGDHTAISASAERGLDQFLVHCKSCHGGPHFQDDRFHAIGVAQFGEHVPDADLGRFVDVAPLLASTFNTAGPFSDGGNRLDGVAQEPAQKGQFRTPTLRNVAVTAPYMHAGQFPTLAAVVKFYNAGGGRVAGIEKDAEMKPLGLTPEQQADLVEFMTALTDTAVPPELLVDTSR